MLGLRSWICRRSSVVMLLNLLTTLLITDFDEVRQLAREQETFLKAQRCLEFKQRQRQLPPPLNWIIPYSAFARSLKRDIA